MLNGTAFQAVKFEINAIISNDVLWIIFCRIRAILWLLMSQYHFKSHKKIRPPGRRKHKI